LRSPMNGTRTVRIIEAGEESESAVSKDFYADGTDSC